MRCTTFEFQQLDKTEAWDAISSLPPTPNQALTKPHGKIKLKEPDLLKQPTSIII